MKSRMNRIYLELSVAYLSFLAALSLFYGAVELVGYHIFLTPLVLTALFPLCFLKNVEKKWIFTLFTVFLAVVGFLIALYPVNVWDVMGGFSLLVASALMFYSIKDTLRLLYSGLSFYIVGLFLLLAIGILNIIILLAKILDYYIQCIGEPCGGYPLNIRPEIFLFFLGLFALYPFFHRWEFRRRIQ